MNPSRVIRNPSPINVSMNYRPFSPSLLNNDRNNNSPYNYHPDVYEPKSGSANYYKLAKQTPILSINAQRRLDEEQNRISPRQNVINRYYNNGEVPGRSSSPALYESNQLSSNLNNLNQPFVSPRNMQTISPIKSTIPISQTYNNQPIPI